MTEATETPQKFMIKLPPTLHRELMAYAGVKGEAMSDILVKWISSVWAQQPEHEALSKMVTPTPVAPKTELVAQKKEAAKSAGSVTNPDPTRAKAKPKKKTR